MEKTGAQGSIYREMQFIEKFVLALPVRTATHLRALGATLGAWECQAGKPTPSTPCSCGTLGSSWKLFPIHTHTLDTQSPRGQKAPGSSHTPWFGSEAGIWTGRFWVKSGFT